jgi:periplasmic protein TonB
MPLSRSAALWPGPASRLRPPLSLPWAAVLAAGACLGLALGLSARWQQRRAAPSPPVLWVQPVSPPAAPLAVLPLDPPARPAAPATPDAASPPPPAAATPRKAVAAPAQSRRTAPVPASRTPAPAQDARPGQKLPTDADPVSAQVAEPLPGAGSDAPAAPAAAPASVPAQAPATAAAPLRGDARTVCPVQVEPKWPETVYTEALGDEAVVKTLARVRDGRVVSVDILSGPRMLHRAVREAMLQYRCQTLPGVTHEITQDFRFRQEGVR